MISKAVLNHFLKSQNIPLFRAKQILHAIYREGKRDYGEISVLPKNLRDQLREKFPIFSFEVEREVESVSGDTVKTLFKLIDGKLVEGVLMRFKDSRNSVCVSSQVGCGLKCGFCATGTMGFTRNLTAEEIADQVLYFNQFLMVRAHGASARQVRNPALPVPNKAELKNKVNHVVFMGMGEPMLNYDAVMESVRVMNDPDCLGLGARNITISTSGVIPGIEKLSREPLQINLALSLHSPSQEIREKIMPIARAYKLPELMAAMQSYIERTRRRVSYEYVMLKNINDTPELAHELGKLIQKTLCHVNLIPYNQTYLGFSNSGKSRIDHFKEIVESYKIPVTVRVSLGQDISAACGQLAVQKSISE